MSFLVLSDIVLFRARKEPIHWEHQFLDIEGICMQKYMERHEQEMERERLRKEIQQLRKKIEKEQEPLREKERQELEKRKLDFFQAVEEDRRKHQEEVLRDLHRHTPFQQEMLLRQLEEPIDKEKMWLEYLEFEKEKKELEVRAQNYLNSNHWSDIVNAPPPKKVAKPKLSKQQKKEMEIRERIRKNYGNNIRENIYEVMAIVSGQW
ncbi:hypothetical protein EBS02_06315 [bacterium]|nr:hypothetical protein [bacterium]